jgi:ubiquinone/menaquinone biosynthesis C-methylase UbiE
VTVQLDPHSTLDPERFLDYEQSVKRSALVDRALKVIDRPGMRVCDIGGASGVLLTEIARQCPHPIQSTILDVVGSYRARLVDPTIEFVQASIVDNQLPSACFDVMTARHVLHHLVGDTVEQTLALQRRAVAEMLRMTRPGGYLLIEEEVNRKHSFSRMIYYLSRFTSRHRIRVRFFETGRVVVSFMTPAEMAEAVDDVARTTSLQVLETRYVARVVQWRWRLTLLMADIGDLLYVIRKE